MGIPKEKSANGNLEVAGRPRGVDHVKLLYDNLESAKHPSEKSSLADEIISFGTTDTYDGYTLLRVVERGAALAARAPRRNEENYGLMIIQGVEGYLAEQDLLFKTVLPSSTDHIAYASIPQLLEKVDAQLSRLGLSEEEIPQLVSFRHAFQRFYRRAISNEKVVVNVFEFRNSERVRIDEGEMMQYIKNASTAKHLGTPTRGAAPSCVKSDPEDTAVYRQIFEIQRKAREKRLNNINSPNGTPDKMMVELVADHESAEDKGATLFSKKVAGISIEEIFEESDQDEFNAKVLAYVGSLPKGDVFWQTLAAGLFLSDPFVGNGQRAREVLAYPEMSLRLTRFHRWVADMIYYPGMGGKDFDASSDAKFKEFFTQLDGYALGDLLEVSFSTVLYRPLQEFFYETDMWNMDGSATISTLVQPELDPYPPEVQRLLSEVVVGEKMRERTNDITTNLRERFGNEAEYLIEAVTSKTESLDAKKLLGLNAASRWREGRYVEPSIHNNAQLWKEARVAWLDSLMSQKARSDGRLYSAYIQYPPENAPAQFGFDHIRLFRGDSSMIFALGLKRDNFYVIGQMHPDGKLEYLNVSLGKHKEFATSIERMLMYVLDGWRKRLGIPFDINEEAVKRLNSNIDDEELREVRSRLKGHIDDDRLDRVFPARESRGQEASEKKPALSPDEVYDLFEKLINGESSRVN